MLKRSFSCVLFLTITMLVAFSSGCGQQEATTATTTSTSSSTTTSGATTTTAAGATTTTAAGATTTTAAGATTTTAAGATTTTAAGATTTTATGATTTTTTGAATTTTTTSTSSTTSTTGGVGGLSVTVAGQASGTIVSGSGLKAMAVSGFTNARADLGYYSSNGSFNVTGTATTDSDGKYQISASVPPNETRNLTVLISKEGTSYRSVIPSVSTEGANIAPLCGPDSELRSKIFYSMLTGQGMSREAIDWTLIEQKTANINTSTNTSQINELASAFKDYQDSQDSILSSLDISPAQLAQIKQKKLQLEKQYLEPMRATALNANDPLSPVNAKLGASSMESDMADFVKNLGINPDVYVKVTGGLDNRLKGKVSSSNPMYATVASNASIDGPIRAHQNLKKSGWILSTYLTGSTFDTTYEAAIETNLANLRSKATATTTSDASSAIQSAFTALYSSAWWPKVYGGSKFGPSIAWWNSSNSLIKQFFTTYGGGQTGFDKVKVGVNAGWEGVDFDAQTDAAVFVASILNAQSIIAASVEAVVSPSLTTQHEITSAEVKKAVTIIMGPAE